MNSLSKHYPIIVILAIILFSGGCSTRTPEAVYYTLNSVNDTSMDKATLSQEISIGIGLAKFPSELDRQSIVTRTGDNRLIVNEFNRWGGSLEKDFLRVLADNLMQLLQTDQVMIRPWESFFQPDLHIALDVHQFDGRLAESAELKVNLAIYKKNSQSNAIIKRIDLKETITEDGYDALVSAQSRLVYRLSEETVDILTSFQFSDRNKK